MEIIKLSKQAKQVNIDNQETFESLIEIAKPLIRLYCDAMLELGVHYVSFAKKLFKEQESFENIYHSERTYYRFRLDTENYIFEIADGVYDLGGKLEYNYKFHSLDLLELYKAIPLNLVSFLKTLEESLSKKIAARISEGKEIEEFVNAIKSTREEEQSDKQDIED